MPTVYALLPDDKKQYFASDGSFASGYQMFVYTAGTSTKATTYQESDGVSSNTNPVILNSSGELPYGLYVEDGSYKLVFATDTDTDPPATPVWTRDDVKPAGLPTVSVDEWVTSTLTPTWVNASTFTLDADQTAEYHVGRRVRVTDTGGTDYGTIDSTSFSVDTTTITVELDSGTIDSGLSRVDYSLLSADASTVPHLVSDSDGLTLSADSGLTLAGEPETALDAVSLRMLGDEFIQGFTLSNNATDPAKDLDFSAGAAVDSTGAYGLVLTGAGLTKQLDAAWAVGTDAGGLFTGTVAASTWYHCFIIRKDSDGSIDAGFDTSVIASNIPSGYTAYRRVGSIVTDATPDIRLFHQAGDIFYWKSPTEDMDDATVGTTAQDIALTGATAGVPPSRSIEAWANVYNTVGRIYIRSSLSGFVDLAPATDGAPLSTYDGTAGVFMGPFITDTSSQLNFRGSATTTVRMSVICYRDPRI